jgi:paraquat-inducible protein B
MKPMAKKANRKMIGGFVVIAVAILAASVTVFGPGDFFKEKNQCVLYFESSVKGLNVGSPVLYRGVQVGMVKKIVIRTYWKELKSYIPVFIEVYPEKFELVTEGTQMEELKQGISKLIEQGLRAQLVTESIITGQLLIEVDMHPGEPLNLKGLDKGYIEIPTIPSTLERFGMALQKLNIQEMETRLNSILHSVDRILKNVNIEDSLNELNAVFQQVRGILGNVNGKIGPLADNLNRTISDSRGLVNRLDGEVSPLAGKAKSALDDIGRLARDVDTRVDPLSKSVTETSSALKSAAQSFDGLVGKTSPTRADLDNALKELSGAARSLRVLADYLEQHPDSLLKGKGRTGY